MLTLYRARHAAPYDQTDTRPSCGSIAENEPQVLDALLALDLFARFAFLAFIFLAVAFAGAGAGG